MVGNELAASLSRALMPDRDGRGIERRICEQILADALATFPPPRTLRELVVVISRDFGHRGSVAFELTVELRSRAFTAPETPLEEVV